MTDRTFKQHAMGFGEVPSQVVFQLDGNTVFSGAVTTVDEEFPSLPDLDYRIDNIAWTWTDDVEFSGTKSISIAVTGSPLMLADTLANNPLGNAELFVSFYSVEIDGVTYEDPLTDEEIDGVPQSGPPDPTLPGQWWWTIPAGSTFTATMHVNAPAAPE